jgi:hypothetical protein
LEDKIKHSSCITISRPCKVAIINAPSINAAEAKHQCPKHQSITNLPSINAAEANHDFPLLTCHQCSMFSQWI